MLSNELLQKYHELVSSEVEFNMTSFTDKEETPDQEPIQVSSVRTTPVSQNFEPSIPEPDDIIASYQAPTEILTLLKQEAIHAQKEYQTYGTEAFSSYYNLTKVRTQQSNTPTEIRKARLQEIKKQLEAGLITSPTAETMVKDLEHSLQEQSYEEQSFKKLY